MPSGLPATHSRDLARILKNTFEFHPEESRGGSHQTWIKHLSDGTILSPTLLLNRQYRPDSLIGLLEDACISRQSFAAVFHKLRKGHQFSEETKAIHT